MLLQNKTAVITGGSEGIGFGIARVFLENGAIVLLIGRDQDKLDTAREALAPYRQSVQTCAADLTEECELKTVYDSIQRHFSHLDILVNNAGIARFESFGSVDPELLELHIRLNIKAPYLLTQRLLPMLMAVQGNVINISSYFADKMLPDRPSTAYSLTKGAIDSFTKALAFELGPEGVRVNAIAPGTVNTPLVKGNLSRLDEQQRERFASMIKTMYPMGRVGEPEDIGHAATYLASHYADWVTGAIFHIDGGLTTS